MGNSFWQVSQNLSIKGKRESETLEQQVNILKKMLKTEVSS